MSLRPYIKWALYGGGITATTTLMWSLQHNQQQLDSIGIVRLSRAAMAAYQIGRIYQRELYALKLDPTSSQYHEIKSNCHRKGANKLLELCRLNRGVYIKVGQHIAALDYLVPKEYVGTLKVLHSDAPQTDYHDICKVIKEDLQIAKIDDVFMSFDPTPVGAASLAQVHRATLPDGTKVAVKVQHPQVGGNAAVDMATMELLVRILARVFPEFKFQWLLDETKRNVPQELDFHREAENAEKIRRLFENCHWLKVPKVFWNLSTSRVLTMEYMEGGQVDNQQYYKDHQIDPQEVTAHLGELYSKMVFEFGFVHSDPHPGNILVRRSTLGHAQIVLLDHGLYATLTEDFRSSYSQLWLSILARDRKRMRQFSGHLGIHGDAYGLFACMVTGRTWDTIVHGLDRAESARFTNKEKQFVRAQFSGILPQMTDVLSNVNRQMLLVLKTNDLLRGIEHTLQTSKKGSFEVMSTCCVRAVYDVNVARCHSQCARVKLYLSKLWQLLTIKIYYLLQ